MSRAVISLLLCLISSVAAVAQSDDLKAVLGAIEAVNKRLDGMQTQIEEIQRGGSRAPAEAQTKGPAASQQAIPNPPGMKPQTGWLFSAVPFDRSVAEPDALFRFSRPSMPVKFGNHLDTRRIQNWVRYRGEAKLNIHESGRHVFALDIQNGNYHSTRCRGYFRVNKSEVFRFGSRDNGEGSDVSVQRGQSTTVSGGMTLDVGNYDALLFVSCFPNCGDTDQECWRAWHNTAFDLQMRGPSDNAPRPFARNEVFYWVRDTQPAPTAQPAQKRSESPARVGGPTPGTTGSLPVATPAVGSKRLVNSSLNVRVSPSGGVQVAAKLRPGEQIVVVQHVALGEWVLVSKDGRNLGYVKTTALLLNTQ